MTALRRLLHRLVPGRICGHYVPDPESQWGIYCRVCEYDPDGHRRRHEWSWSGRKKRDRG